MKNKKHNENSDKQKEESYAEISPPKIKFSPEKIAKILDKKNKKDN